MIEFIKHLNSILRLLPYNQHNGRTFNYCLGSKKELKSLSLILLLVYNYFRSMTPYPIAPTDRLLGLQ